MNFNTKLLHGKSIKKYADGATLPPISQVSAYRFDTAQEQEKVFNHRAFGFAYTRVGNPTVAAFEQRIAELEGGSGAIAFSSGMSAITVAILNILSTGDEIISSGGLYGGTMDLFRDFERFGIKTRYVSHFTKEEIEKEINDNTKIIFGETISNPALEITDIEEVAALSHSHGIPLIIDNTTATPYLVNPLSLGADIVVHSTTKYINGSGNSVGGVIVDGGKFSWDFEKYAALSPFKKYGKAAYSVRIRSDLGENIGGTMAPLTAYLNVIGLETLGLRMQRICDNAKALAEALNENKDITVNYPTLGTDHNTALAAEELKGFGGGLITIRVGSKERAYRILNSLEYAVRATSLGDVRTLVIHPASTLYIHSTKEEQEIAGVYDDLIRISTGIEDPEDLIEDFTKAIKASDEAEN
ncbi:MAG: O-acetylhomoserine aminocarboxypropyltransferase/cysteine synthase [Lachnospiraceae bacterium]|nr:O-acetylhomoserine aminocarboxypropyltransferase/cysteine synthase [Lachnospiraceae bacterium]